LIKAGREAEEGRGEEKRETCRDRKKRIGSRGRSRPGGSHRMKKQKGIEGLVEVRRR
jgi:hypothetical protein